MYNSYNRPVYNLQTTIHSTFGAHVTKAFCTHFMRCVMYPFHTLLMSVLQYQNCCTNVWYSLDHWIMVYYRYFLAQNKTVSNIKWSLEKNRTLTLLHHLLYMYYFVQITVDSSEVFRPDTQSFFQELCNFLEQESSDPSVHGFFC